MSKRQIYDFLRDLSENNHKDWMDAHRDRYETAKAIWLAECEQFLERFARHDPYYELVEAKDTLERINHNLFYHPDRPTYKDHFGFSPSDQKGGGIYVSVSPAYSFIGGGLHNPSNEQLRAIRAAIDADPDELQALLSEADFQAFYGGLDDDPDKLKTSPQGYSQDHPQIEWLRRKHFTVRRRVTQEEVLGADFPDLVERAFLIMKPLNDFLFAALGQERQPG